MIETVRLIAAGLATVFFLLGAFTKLHEDLDRFMISLQRAGRFNAIGAFFAAVVFACELAIWIWPGV